MKRTLTLSALLMAGAIPAMAADLPVKAPPPIAAPILLWNGFYAGFNGGYSWGHSSRELNFVTATGAAIVPAGGVITSGGTELEGGLFGGQIGYNWQTSPTGCWASKPTSSGRTSAAAGPSSATASAAVFPA